MLKERLRRFLYGRGYVVFNRNSPAGYARDGLFTSHNSGFRDDPRFQAAYARGIQAGGYDPQIEWRVHVALWAARNAVRLPGDFVECGVNAGFMASAIMHHLDWAGVPKYFHLVDTFAGPVPEQFSEEEVRLGNLRVVEEAMASGGYVTDMARMRVNFAEWPNARIVQGAVPEVLPRVDARAVAFLHIDMNCAYPERAALEHFWGRLSPGAMVLFDDYAYAGNEYVTGVLDTAARGLGAQILSLPTGQGLIIR